MTPPKTQAAQRLAAPPQTGAVPMDRAYEGDATRQLVLQLGFEPVVPPNPNRRHPWTYDHSLYRRRN